MFVWMVKYRYISLQCQQSLFKKSQGVILIIDDAPMCLLELVTLVLLCELNTHINFKIRISICQTTLAMCFHLFFALVHIIGLYAPVHIIGLYASVHSYQMTTSKKTQMFIYVAHDVTNHIGLFIVLKNTGSHIRYVITDMSLKS